MNHCFQVGNAANGVVATLADLLKDNAEDHDLCAWASQAKPGDEYMDGEGVVCLDDAA